MPNTLYMQIRIKHVDQELNLKCCWWLLWKDDENEKTVTMSLILMMGSHMCTQCLLRNVNEGSSREEDWHLCSDPAQVSGSVSCYILRVLTLQSHRVVFLLKKHPVRGLPSINVQYNWIHIHSIGQNCLWLIIKQ